MDLFTIYAGPAAPPVLPDRELPDARLRLFLRSIEEVLGRAGLKAVVETAQLPQLADCPSPQPLDHGGTFSQYARLEQAIEDLYGPRGARAMLLRVGRAMFQEGLKEQSTVLGLAAQALKSAPLLSLEAKLRLLLQQAVTATNKAVNQPTRLDEDRDAFYVVVDWCTCQYRPPHYQPACLVTVGTYAEATRWLADRSFEVREVSCQNLGADACRFRIPKQPDE